MSLPSFAVATPEPSHNASQNVKGLAPVRRRVVDTERVLSEPAGRLSQKRSFTALINLHADLLRSGYYADDETVRLIMRELGLEPCQPKPFRPITTIAGDGCSPAAGAGRRCARPTSGSAKDGRSGLLHLRAIHVDMALRWQVRRGHVPVELERRAKPGIDQGVEQGVDLLWGLVRCGVEPTGDDG